jgi:hypothetical protein
MATGVERKRRINSFDFLFLTAYIVISSYFSLIRLIYLASRRRAGPRDAIDTSINVSVSA